MKKFLAILLALICVFSVTTASVAAADLEDILGDVIEDQIGVTKEESELDVITYGIYFKNDETSFVSTYYMPTHTLTLSEASIVTITDDTPVAVDHNWVCWKDKETGKYYYPGDEIEVRGQVTLVAVWEEKTDNYPTFIRSAIAGFQAFYKLINKFFNAFDTINSTRPIEGETTTVAPSYNNVTTLPIG